jgi:glucan phosphorylase
VTSSSVHPDALSQLLLRLPSELAPLARVAFNCAWSWHPEGEALFRAVDPELWAACGGNPVRLLSETSRIVDEAFALELNQIKALGIQALMARTLERRAVVYGDLIARCAHCHRFARPEEPTTRVPAAQH